MKRHCINWTFLIIHFIYIPVYLFPQNIYFSLFHLTWEFWCCHSEWKLYLKNLKLNLWILYYSNSARCRSPIQMSYINKIILNSWTSSSEYFWLRGLSSLESSGNKPYVRLWGKNDAISHSVCSVNISLAWCRSATIMNVEIVLSGNQSRKYAHCGLREAGMSAGTRSTLT
jgi:hypothetical protein